MTRVRYAALLGLLLVATPVWAGQLTLTWIDPAVNEQGFKVERCQIIAPATSCANYVQIASLPAVAVTAVDGSGVPYGLGVWVNQNLTPGLTYCYRIRAFNAQGNSAYSNEACGTVAANAVPLDPANLGVQ